MNVSYLAFSLFLWDVYLLFLPTTGASMQTCYFFSTNWYTINYKNIKSTKTFPSLVCSLNTYIIVKMIREMWWRQSNENKIPNCFIKMCDCLVRKFKTDDSQSRAVINSERRNRWGLKLRCLTVKLNNNNLDLTFKSGENISMHFLIPNL